MNEGKKALKKALYDSNQTLLMLIYYIGGGVMFNKQIDQYIDQSAWRLLKVLEEAQLIDLLKFHNKSIIRLKQFVLTQIQGKELEAPLFTRSRVVRSAFISELMLCKYKIRKESDKSYTLEKFIKSYKGTTNMYWCQNNMDLVEHIKERFLKVGLNTSGIDEQIKFLQIEDQIKKIKDAELKAKMKKEKGTTLNMLEMSNIFVETINIKSKQCNIAILLMGLEGPSEIGEKLIKAFDCLSNMIDFEIISKNMTKRFKYVIQIYVADEMKKKSILSKKNFRLIEQKLIGYGVFNELEWRVIDLNITKTIFSNKRIII